MAQEVVAKKDKKSGNPLGSIAEILASAGQINTIFSGQEQTTRQSGSTRTSGLDISQQGIDKVIQDILESTQGLSAVSSGQRGAGLYNSTTNQQLTNDLLTRTGGEAAKLSAKEVTTQGPSTTTTVTPPSLDIGTALLGTAATTIGKKLFEGAADGTIQNASGFIDALVSTPSLSTASSGLGFIDSAVSSGGVGDLIGGAFGGGSDLIGEVFGGLDFLGDAGGAFGGLPIASIGLDLLSGDPEDALGGAAGYLIGNALLPGIGGPLGSLVSEILPVGDIFDTVGSLFGGLFGGSVVCTELLRQGKMSKYLYTTDIIYARDHMSAETLNGYRYWGIPLVRLMRRSELVSNIAAWFAVARAHYVVSLYDDGFYNAKLARRGKIINAIGVPLCNMIAAVTTPKDWSVLYTGGKVA